VWDVRSGGGGPGPNTWDDANASVDGSGALHLHLTQVISAWHTAEISTRDRLGFGTYQFEVAGPLDQFDPNVVLGLFNYPPPDVGPDGTNEIDIEVARWGNAGYPNGNYTVWPAQVGPSPVGYSFEFSLTQVTSTHSFLWTPQYVAFHSAQPQGVHDHPEPVEGDRVRLASAQPFANWTTAQHIPQNPMPVHMNLWLFQGQPPGNGQPVEIVISNFTYTPLSKVFLPTVRISA
jgi:hypothetical protein